MSETNEFQVCTEPTTVPFVTFIYCGNVQRTRARVQPVSEQQHQQDVQHRNGDVPESTPQVLLGAELVLEQFRLFHLNQSRTGTDKQTTLAHPPSQSLTHLRSGSPVHSLKRAANVFSRADFLAGLLLLSPSSTLGQIPLRCYVLRIAVLDHVTLQ